MLSFGLVERKEKRKKEKVGRPKGSKNSKSSSASLRAVSPIQSLTNVHIYGVNGIMKITKQVTKQVTHPITAQKVTRTANVTFEVPEYSVKQVPTGEKDKDGNPIVEDAYDFGEGALALKNAFTVFGTPERLIAFAMQGLFTVIRTNESNELGKSDAATKMMSKTSALWKKINPEISDEEIRAMIMSNPKMAESLAGAAEDFKLEISKTVDHTKIAPSILDDLKPTTAKPTVVEDDEEEDEVTTA